MQHTQIPSKPRPSFPQHFIFPLRIRLPQLSSAPFVSTIREFSDHQPALRISDECPSRDITIYELQIQKTGFMTCLKNILLEKDISRRGYNTEFVKGTSARLHSLKLTFSPLSKRNIVFQPSIVRCEKFVSGRVT